MNFKVELRFPRIWFDLSASKVLIPVLPPSLGGTGIGTVEFETYKTNQVLSIRGEKVHFAEF